MSLAAVWYSVQGNGNPLTVHVCALNGQEIDFGVFSYCNSEQCFGYPSSFFLAECQAGRAENFTINSQSGAAYYVHVRADNQTAQFQITLTGEGSSSGNGGSNGGNGGTTSNGVTTKNTASASSLSTAFAGTVAAIFAVAFVI